MSRDSVDRTIVIKVGGAVADLDGALLGLPALIQAGYGVTIVHGGGKEISTWMARLSLPVQFKDGLRVTDAASMEIAAMVLRGKVSAMLSGALVRRGVRAVGLCGVDAGIFTARPHPDPDLGLVGEVDVVNADLLHLLMTGGFVPVLAPIAQDSFGDLRNINADSVCGAVAGALNAELAVFLTDVPGVRDRSSAILERVTSAQAAALIADGTICGGMLPKVRACLAALASGARAVCIADGRDADALRPMLDGGQPRGTVVTAPDLGVQ